MSVFTGKNKAKSRILVAIVTFSVVFGLFGSNFALAAGDQPTNDVVTGSGSSGGTNSASTSSSYSGNTSSAGSTSTGAKQPTSTSSSSSKTKLVQELNDLYKQKATIEASVKAKRQAAEDAGYDSDDPALDVFDNELSAINNKIKSKQAQIDKINTNSGYEDSNDDENNDPNNKSGSGYDPTLDPKTLIPSTDLDQQKCFNILYALQISDEQNLASLTIEDAKTLNIPGGKLTATQMLGCAIKTGLVKLWMLPIFIKYIIDFLLSIAGLIAVLFVMIGGYLYMFGGLSSDKEKGKNAIIYGIVGFVVALLAWVVVNAIQLLVTS